MYSCSYLDLVQVHLMSVALPDQPVDPPGALTSDLQLWSPMDDISAAVASCTLSMSILHFNASFWIDF